MEDVIKSIAGTWFKEPGASQEQIQELENSLNLVLPESYKVFLSWSDGGGGNIGITYLSFWKSNEVHQLNEDYEVSYAMPSVLGIGSDGGGECYALNYNTDNSNPSLIRVPFGVLDFESSIVIGSTFEDGLRNLVSELAS